MKYKIPIRDSLVVSHINPDGDSVSSVKAVLNYLEKNGKYGYTKIIGEIPEHLSWILLEENFLKKPVEQIIVLDCAPTVDRIGFKLPELNIINIDHHVSRIDEHSIRDNIYVLERCSTASALVLDFNIIDNILLVDLYTDTLFMRSLKEVFKVIKILDLNDIIMEKILSSLKPQHYKQTLSALKDSRLHKCKNGFLIVETEEKDPLIVAEITDTIFRYSQNLVVIDGNNYARLRTSNQNLIDNGKLSEIASIFGGGGNNYASATNIDGKKTTFIGVIKQLEIIDNKLLLDGYNNIK
jgi:nanoRNase/pAp phosphatase (c-di-AMP/oligoRNAs hydrolase)